MEADFPDKLEFLFQPHRYKVAYGGRGSGKSWGFARALLLQATKKSSEYSVLGKYNGLLNNLCISC